MCELYALVKVLELESKTTYEHFPGEAG